LTGEQVAGCDLPKGIGILEENSRRRWRRNQHEQPSSAAAQLERHLRLLNK
jgi:hypothetical protein